MSPRSVGVEEELLLVDPATGGALALSAAVLRSATDGQCRPASQLTSELTGEQVETNTRPCTSLPELAHELHRWRHVASDAAARVGARVAALGTSPIPVDPSITPAPRYQRMLQEFGLTVAEQLTCGCHIHVQVESAAEGVAVLDRIRGWLPCLLAISANSPFWQGRDSGYASYRSQVWGRWPSAGPTGCFGCADTYHATVQAMLDTGTILDRGMIYFDARLSHRQPTVEVRVADVCLIVADTVLLAALARGLVETAARAWRAGAPAPALRTEVLRLASWRAGRSGLSGDLVGPTGYPEPAEAVLCALTNHIRPALADLGDLRMVGELMSALLSRGNGATEQHRVYRSSGRLSDVVTHATERTLASISL
jgi:carboxylate-amine ligase